MQRNSERLNKFRDGLHNAQISGGRDGATAFDAVAVLRRGIPTNTVRNGYKKPKPSSVGLEVDR